MDKEQYEVLVVDSHPIVREGLKQFLEADGVCRVVAEAGDGPAALFASVQHDHQVLLINAVLPGSDIFEIINSYKTDFPDRQVVVCHVNAELGLLQEFRKNGVDAFIGQQANSIEYSTAVRAVMAGGNFLSRNLSDVIFKIGGSTSQLGNAYGLTGRELEILSLLANGLCNKEIANRFDLSVRTVETHRLNIRRKTSSNTLSDLVRIARSLGIAHLGEVALNPAKETQALEQANQ